MREDRTMETLRINNDINGNPRMVIHFFAFLKDDEKSLNNYALAKKRANEWLGAKVYRGKRFGGGFVCQAFESDSQIEKIINDNLGEL